MVTFTINIPQMLVYIPAPCTIHGSVMGIKPLNFTLAVALLSLARTQRFRQDCRKYRCGDSAPRTWGWGIGFGMSGARGPGGAFSTWHEIVG
jgi:hypothetical protein